MPGPGDRDTVAETEGPAVGVAQGQGRQTNDQGGGVQRDRRDEKCFAGQGVTSDGSSEKEGTGHTRCGAEHSRCREEVQRP